MIKEITKKLTEANLPIEFAGKIETIYKIYDRMGHSGASHMLFTASLGEEPCTLEKVLEMREGEYKDFQNAFYIYYPEDKEKRDLLYSTMRKLLRGIPLAIKEPHEIKWVEFNSGEENRRTYATGYMSGLYKDIDENGEVSYRVHDVVSRNVLRDWGSKWTSSYGTVLILEDKEDLRLLPDRINEKYPNRYYLHDTMQLPLVLKEGEVIGSLTDLQKVFYLHNRAGVSPSKWIMDKAYLLLGEGEVRNIYENLIKEYLSPEVITKETLEIIERRIDDYYYLEDVPRADVPIITRMLVFLYHLLREGRVYDSPEKIYDLYKEEYLKPVPVYVNDRYYAKFEPLVRDGKEIWTIGTKPIYLAKEIVMPPTGSSFSEQHARYIEFDNIDAEEFLYTARRTYGLRHPKVKRKCDERITANAKESE